MTEENNKFQKVEQIDGGKEINNFIDKSNQFEEDFITNIKSPLDKQRADSLKIVMLNTTKGANIKHAYIGSVLCMIAAKPEMTVEDLQKTFSFKEEEPYIQVNVDEYRQNTFDSLETWIKLYVEKAKLVPGLLTQFEGLFTEAGNVLKNATSEYDDLDLMAKAKMVKAHSNRINQIKGRLTTVKKDCQAIIDELKSFKDALDVLQIEVKNGKLLENGKKAKDAEKSTCKGCYEEIYGAILEQKAGPGAGGDDEGGMCKGKCVTF